MDAKRFDEVSGPGADLSSRTLPFVLSVIAGSTRNLPFASTLNGSCRNVCPVKINIHEQIYAWRRVLAAQHEVPLAKRAAMKAASKLLSRPAAYRAAIAAANMSLAHLPRFILYNRLNAWGKHRELPHSPPQTFHSWYPANRGGKQ
jgi:L-lactate dehydrogenase complex protein LldF